MSLAVLLTTACQLRLDVTVDVDRNGGGTVALAVGADEALQQRAAQAQVDPLDDLVQTARALRADGWRVSDRTSDGLRTVTLSRDFADPDEFNRLFAQLSDALAADEVALLEPFELAVSDDRVSVEGGASARPTRAVRDHGLTRPAAVRLIASQEALDYTVTVSLPGETLSTTAPDADRRPLVWRVQPGEQVAIAAESTRPRAPILRAAVGAIGGALVAGGALWLWARRRQASARSARMRAFSART